MKSEDKGKAAIRIEDAEEFIKSAKNNFEKSLVYFPAHNIL